MLLRLLPYVFTLSFAIGLTMAPSLYVFRYLVCVAYYSESDPTGSGPSSPEDPMCDASAVSANMAYITGISSVVAALVSLLASAPVQRLSDKWGRKPMLVILPIIDALAVVVLLLAFTQSSIKAIYTFSLLSTILSSIATKCIFVPTLVIADVSSVEERTPWYSRLGGAAIAGIAIAFVATSLIASLTPAIIGPYFVAMALQLAVAIFALFFIPETRVKSDARTEEAIPSIEGLKNVLWRLLVPLRPLHLLLPKKDSATGRRNWTLMLLASSVFTTGLSTYGGIAMILYMQNHYHFTPGETGFFMAFLMGSRFLFLVLVFPVVLKYGRLAFHRYQLRHPIHVHEGNAAEHEGTTAVTDENTPLLNDSETEVPLGEELVVEAPEKLANHFDIILAYISLVIDAIGMLIVCLSTSWQQIIGAFSLLSLAGGHGASMKSVFIASVEKEQASESLAALEIIMAMAQILSPIILGPIYGALLKVEKGQVLFGISAVIHFFASLFLLPIRRI